MKTRAQKEESVVKLTEKFGRAKSIVFANYKGMTMNQISALRNKLAETDAEFSITKNSLVGISLENCKLKIVNSVLTGPLATLFSYGDEILPLKALTKAIKDNAVGEIKGGFFNGEFMEGLSVIRLSTLPTKLELQAKVVGCLAAPLSGMVNVLQGNLRNLVYALDQLRLNRSQVRISKGGEL